MVQNPLHGVERLKRLREPYHQSPQRIRYMELKVIAYRVVGATRECGRIRYMELKEPRDATKAGQPHGGTGIRYMELKEADVEGVHHRLTGAPESVTWS